MKTATRTAPVADKSKLPSTVVLVTYRDGELHDVTSYGQDVESAKSYASARREDGDGSCSFSLARLYGPRALRIDALVAEGLKLARNDHENHYRIDQEMIAAYLAK